MHRTHPPVAWTLNFTVVRVQSHWWSLSSSFWNESNQQHEIYFHSFCVWLCNSHARYFTSPINVSFIGRDGETHHLYPNWKLKIAQSKPNFNHLKIWINQNCLKDYCQGCDTIQSMKLKPEPQFFKHLVAVIELVWENLDSLTKNCHQRPFSPSVSPSFSCFLKRSCSLI